MTTALHWLGLLLALYGVVLFARFVMSWVLALTQYRPTGAAAVGFEFVYAVTDPPLKFLGRFIPPLNMGRMSLDVSFIVLIIAVQIVAKQLRQW